jgi:hypothetical protein
VHSLINSDTTTAVLQSTSSTRAKRETVGYLPGDSVVFQTDNVLRNHAALRLPSGITVNLSN